MANLVTASQTRNITGAPESLISDSIINDLITEVEEKTLSSLRTFKEPTQFIDFLDGNGKRVLRPNRLMLLKLQELKSRDTTFDLDYISFSFENGIIKADSLNSTQHFYVGNNNIRIKYLCGFMEKTNTVTSTINAITSKGNNISFDVNSATGFAVNDWIILQDMDGKTETTQIININSNTITVNNLVNTFLEESIVTKLDTHSLLKDLILYESALAVSQYAIGSTYTFNTSYSKGGASFNKGVPYPHWEKNAQLSERRRDEVMKKINKYLNPLKVSFVR